MAFNIILGALTLIMDKLESLTDVAVRIRRALEMGFEDRIFSAWEGHKKSWDFFVTNGFCWWGLI